MKIGPNPILDLKFEASKLRSSKETVSSKPIFFNDLLEMRNMMVKDINSQNLNITSHVKKINIMFLSYCLANRISETISITPGQIKNALRDNEINIYQREVDCSRRVFGKSVMSLEGTKTKSKFENNDKIEQYSYIKPLLKSFKQIFEELCTLEYVIFINFLTLRITSDNINIRINSKGHALGLYFKSKKEYSINLNKCPRELTVVEFSRLIQSKVKELISLDEIFLSKDIEKKILRQTVFRVSKSSLNTNIKLYMKLIGRPGKHSSHGLRHGFVTETYTMLSKNEELNEQQRIDFIRKLTGHKKGSRVMEMIYIQVNTDVNELNKLNYGDELDEMTRELTNKPQMDVKVSESMSTSEKINQIVKRNLSHNDSVQSVLIKSIIVDCHREIGIELSEKEVSDILLKIA